MKSTRTSIYRSLQALFYSESLCSGCRKARSKQLSTINRGLHSSLTKHRLDIQDANTSSIAKQIRETGQLPSLPTESVIELPKLRQQRKLRNENIVRDDMQATLEAHYTANVLAHGNIHIKLDGSLYSKPRRLAVTVPVRSDDMENTRQLLVKDTNEDNDPISELIPLDNSGQHNPSPAAIQRARIEKNRRPATTSDLRDKLLQADQSLDALHRLDTEIRIFQEWIELTQDECDAASDTWSRFQQTMLENFPKYKFELYGSRSTGLARPFSDIDIRIVIPELETEKRGRGPSPGRPKIKKKYIQALKRIKHWCGQEIARDLNAKEIRDGRVPVLDMKTRTGWRFDIQLSATVGKPVDHATEFVKYFLKEHPQIKPLFVLIRWWLERSDIGDASNGGLSSYLTFCMILTSITHSKQSFNGGELGRQLLHFLRFWTTADWQNIGFAPDPARTFPKCAINLEAETCSEETQITRDHACKALFTDEIPYNGTTAEQDLRRPQLGTTDPSSNKDDSNGAPLPTLTQAYSLNRPVMEAEDFATSVNNDQESDVYFEGIRFLAYRANRKCRKPEDRLVYFLLQDPADPMNNIGSSLKKLPELCRLMKRALGCLEKNIQHWDKRVSSDGDHQSQEFILEDLIYAKARDEFQNLDLDRIVQNFEGMRRNFAYLRSLKSAELKSPQQKTVISEGP